MTPEREAHLRKLARYYLHQRLVDAHEASEALTEAHDALGVARRERDDYYGALKLQQESILVSLGRKPLKLVHECEEATDFTPAKPRLLTCAACYYQHVNFAGSIETSVRCEHPDADGRDLPTQLQSPDWCHFKVGRKP